MIRIFSNLVRFLLPAPSAVPFDGVANSLMEKAQDCAGRNPWQARQLRLAASAYLSVVR